MEIKGTDKDELKRESPFPERGTAIFLCSCIQNEEGNKANRRRKREKIKELKGENKVIMAANG